MDTIDLFNIFVKCALEVRILTKSNLKVLPSKLNNGFSFTWDVKRRPQRTLQHCIIENVK